MYRKIVFFILLLLPLVGRAQFNTDKLVNVGRNALYYEDYVLSIQYFNQAINSKPYLYEPWFYRAVAKYYLGDYTGSERDCSEAIRLNPFVVKNYELRGLVRIQQKKYKEAISDYVLALKYDPENEGLWNNRVLCRIHENDYDGALADIDTMLTMWKRNAKAYSMQSEVYLLQKDTAKAVKALERSIDINPYDASTWAVRSAISLNREEWNKAEEFLDKAIHLQSGNAGYYINRALARLKRNNLRGAMDDYDIALDLDPESFLGHYNRGLLRAHVGDDNTAIIDFDFVLKLEPDNVMALFNRAILLDKTGDLRGAIRDYTAVIKKFPNFWTGLLHRAACYRRLGMTKQAEADEFKVYKARMYKSLYGKQPRMSKEQIRRQSDVDPDKYNQIVVADDNEVEHKYTSDYRGLVQNQASDMDYMPMYGLSYEDISSDIRRYVPFDRLVDAFNVASDKEKDASQQGKRIYINNTLHNLDEKRILEYFKYIDLLTEQISKTQATHSAIKYLFRRALAYSQISNFDSAIRDLDDYIKEDSVSSLAYWQRAYCQFKANDITAAQGKDITIKTVSVLADISKAIEYNPQCAYLYYNRGNVYAMRKDYDKAVVDYNKAIELDTNIAEAYYNRGLAYIHMGEKEKGNRDLSKAGELGLYKAYSIIKKNQ